MKFLILVFFISCTSMGNNSERVLASTNQIQDDIILKYIKMPGMVKDADRKINEVLISKSGRVFSRTTPWKEYKNHKRALKKILMKLNPMITKSINDRISQIKADALLKLEMEKYDAYPCDAGGRSLKLLFLDKEVSIREDKDCNGRFKLKTNMKAFNEVHNLNEIGSFVIELLEFTRLN